MVPLFDSDLQQGGVWCWRGTSQRGTWDKDQRRKDVIQLVHKEGWSAAQSFIVFLTNSGLCCSSQCGQSTDWVWFGSVIKYIWAKKSMRVHSILDTIKQIIFNKVPCTRKTNLCLSHSYIFFLKMVYKTHFNFWHFQTLEPSGDHEDFTRQKPPFLATG